METFLILLKQAIKKQAELVGEDTAFRQTKKGRAGHLERRSYRQLHQQPASGAAAFDKVSYRRSN